MKFFVCLAACLICLAGWSSAEAKTFRVLVLNFDPIIEAEDGKRLHEAMGWNDPRVLAKTYAADLRECSYGFANYVVVDWVDADEWPALVDGFRYDDTTYFDVMRKGGKAHKPEAGDYRAIIRSYKVAERVNSGDIDEVWMFGAPWFGWYESQMCGPGAYWCNSPGLPDIDSGRKFIMMGFNYERGVGEMLEDYGHRTESIMAHVYGGWDHKDPRTHWDRFTLYDRVAPGQSGCGNVHYSPNSPSDYEWGETQYAISTCDDWLHNWPNLKGEKRAVNCRDWGNGEIRAHHRWWFKHIPHAMGRNADGKQNNWWKYLADFNSYPESR